MKLSDVQVKYRCQTSTCSNKYPITVSYLNGDKDMLNIGSDINRICDYCKYPMYIEHMRGKIKNR